MILIGYDGSEDARCAIAQAATLMPGHPALVLTVWTQAESGLTGLRSGSTDSEWARADRAQADRAQAERARAEGAAAEGAQLAHQFGIDCAPCVRGHRGGVAEAILEEAMRVDAQAIVVGRGRGGGDEGLAALPSALVARARCAVLVARSAPAPARRAQG